MEGLTKVIVFFLSKKKKKRKKRDRQSLCCVQILIELHDLLLNVTLDVIKKKRKKKEEKHDVKFTSDKIVYLYVL